jgi:hypothetical protein
MFSTDINLLIFDDSEHYAEESDKSKSFNIGRLVGRAGLQCVYLLK